MDNIEENNNYENIKLDKNDINTKIKKEKYNLEDINDNRIIYNEDRNRKNSNRDIIYNEDYDIRKKDNNKYSDNTNTPNEVTDNNNYDYRTKINYLDKNSKSEKDKYIKPGIKFEKGKRIYYLQKQKKYKKK